MTDSRKISKGHSVLRARTIRDKATGAPLPERAASSGRGTKAITFDRNDDPLNWIRCAEGYPPAVSVPEFPDYVVTIDGRVLGKRKWLTLQTTKDLYQAVTFPKPGCRNRYGAVHVHRLVAAAYFGIPLNDGRANHVNHLDGRKGVNILANLAPATSHKNIAYSYRNGLASHFGNMAREIARRHLSSSGFLSPNMLAIAASPDDLKERAKITAEVAVALFAARKALLSAAAQDEEGAARLLVIRRAIDNSIARLVIRRDEITRAAEALIPKVDRVTLFMRERQRLGATFIENTRPGANVVPDLDPCLIWQGHLSSTGYGSKRIMGRQVGAHVAAYLLFNATEAEVRARWADRRAQLDIRHRCDVASCVNPKHLVLGTRQDNMDDMDRRGRVPRGEARYNAKLTDRNVSLIRWMCDRGEWTQSTISRHFGASQGYIAEIWRGSKRIGIPAMSDAEAAGEALPPPDRARNEPSNGSGERNGTARLSNEDARLLRYMSLQGKWSMKVIRTVFLPVSLRTCFKVAQGGGYPDCPAFSDREVVPHLERLPTPDIKSSVSSSKRRRCHKR